MKKVSNKLRGSAFLVIFAGKAIISFYSIKMLYGHWSETAHLPLSLVNTNTYFSLWAKCWLKGEVMGSFPETYNDPLNV